MNIGMCGFWAYCRIQLKHSLNGRPQYVYAKSITFIMRIMLNKIISGSCCCPEIVQTVHMFHLLQCIFQYVCSFQINEKGTIVKNTRKTFAEKNMLNTL